MVKSLIFTREEIEIYDLKISGLSDADIIAAGYAQLTLDEFYLKVRIVSREHIFYSLLSKYRRILELAQEHYEEKEDKRSHVFSIDFSDLYTYLNPRQANPDAKANIGCIYYIFGFKSENHRYCVLPTTTWKLLNHIFETFKEVKKKIRIGDFDKFINDKQIKNFYNCLNEMDENNLDALMRCYADTGGLAGVINKTLKYRPDEQVLQHKLAEQVLQNKLDDDLRQRVIVIPKMLDDFQKMLEAKIVEPLENFVKDEDVTKVKIEKNRYNEALANLNVYGCKTDVDKKVAAAHFAITYSLTESGLRIYDRRTDEMVTLQPDNDKVDVYPAVYRSISNSSQFIKAFRTKKIGDKYFSCCPQFLSTLILLKRNIVKEFNNTKLTDKIVLLDEKRRCIERIKNQCYDWQYPQRFNMAKYTDDVGRLRETLDSMSIYLGDLFELKYEIFPSLIEPVMKINLGDKFYHRKSKNYNSRDSIETLAPLFKHKCADRYESVATEALNAIYEDIKETYESLYQYAYEKGI